MNCKQCRINLKFALENPDVVTAVLAETPPQSAREITDESLKAAIKTFSDTPTEKNWLACYYALEEVRFLLLAVREAPFPGFVGPIALLDGIPVTVLTTTAPEGGSALVAFTDYQAVSSHAPSAKYMGVPVETVLRMVVDGEYEALIINPSGPLAGIPKEGVRQILEKLSGVRA
jgi:hypothetical protein